MMCGGWLFIVVVEVLIVNLDLARKKEKREKKKTLPYPRHLEPQHPWYTVTVIRMVVMAVGLVAVEVVKVNIEAK